uniref:SH3 domain-containing protein n=1 Tax=Timema shepardi TaxID=629360 RepID=A0A7R9B0K1_TIMSH|nr:unnamed protein product [Timema shepardi]
MFLRFLTRGEWVSGFILYLKRRHSWSSDLDFQQQQQLPPHSAAGRATGGDQHEDYDHGEHDSDGEPVHVPDLVEPCRCVDDAGLSSSGEELDWEEEEAGVGEGEGGQEMGQGSSSFLRRTSRPKISLTWVLRGDRHANTTTLDNCRLPSPTTQASQNTNNNNNNNKEEEETGQEKPVSIIERTPSVDLAPKRTVSEPSLVVNGDSIKTTAGTKEKGRHRRTRTPRHKTDNKAAAIARSGRHSRFGYEIQDVDAFLTKASLEKPANIPMVLSSPCTLYQTREGGYQEELSLPLGMVVNAVFKNQSWLYVQTPHGEEGYVAYNYCLPLGILPPPQRSQSSSAKPPPCWENHTDVFPQPLGNRTDSEKLRDGTRSECGGGGRCHRRTKLERDAVSACGERSVDRLYLRAAASAKRNGTTRHTLLVIRSDYNSKGRNTLSVAKGDVVALVSGHLKDWFWVRSRDGSEGFIPSVVAGHGFL